MKGTSSPLDDTDRWEVIAAMTSRGSVSFLEAKVACVKAEAELWPLERDRYKEGTSRVDWRVELADKVLPMLYRTRRE